MFNIEEIKKILPHRDPFLLIDRVVEMEVGKSAHAIKCVSNLEPYFKGHFPGHPVMPGVLQIETMAQTGAVSILSMEEHKGKIAFFSGIKNAKFRREVVPGDVLDIYVEMTRLRKNFGQGIGKIFIGEEFVCEAEISFFIQE